MRVKVGQCLLLPEVETATVMKLCEEHNFSTDVAGTARLAQLTADEQDEPFLVLQVVRIVNPNRDRGEE